MTIKILQSEMRRHEDRSFVGKSIFSFDNHKANYEITFFSTRGTEWDYSLSFAGEPGSEEEMLQMDALLETNDDVYNELLDAALDAQEVVEEE